MREAAADSPSEWTNASLQFSLHLNPNLIGRLGIDSWAAYKQIPKRGLEIGGILLGRTEVTEDCVHIWIDAYRIVDSEHRTGPSYLLSDADFERLQQEVRSNGNAAVGLFRTHTRSEQVALETPDSEMLARCFDGTPDRSSPLLLLLGPVAGKAAIFARVQDQLQCVFECATASSVSAMLTLGHNRPVRQTPALPEPPPVDRIFPSQGAVPPPPPPVPGLVRLGRASRTWVMPAAIALLACGAIADSVTRSLHHEAVPAVQSEITPPSLLRLAVERVGTSLRLSWDPGAPSLQGGAHAVLRIEDGDRFGERALDPGELKSGTASYEPQSGDVTFRLDIYSSEPRFSGAIQILSPQPVPLIQAAKPISIESPTTIFEESPTTPKTVKIRPAKPTTTDLRGISVSPLNPTLRGLHHLPASTAGVIVTGVRPGSSAFEAVLEEGDVIQEVNRKSIGGVAEFEQAMHDAEGAVVLLSVKRDGALRFHAIP